jgi:hypothetical protein
MHPADPSHSPRPAQRLCLPQVTLCAVDARSPGLAMQSLQRSMAQVSFGRTVLFTHAWQAPLLVPGVEIVDIGPIRSGAEYSHFVLRGLPQHIATSHVLVTQWDGFVVDAMAWRDEFLACDYIGAPWPDQPAEQAVGNGGFSLRSRKLLQAGLDTHITQEHPEDLMLCRAYRARLEQHHGVRFASLDLARGFAFENAAAPGPAFGFHGPYNLPQVLEASTLSAWLHELPDDFFRSRDARRLARALLAQRMPQVATQLLARRRHAGRNDVQTRLLAAAAAVAGWMPGAGRH